MNDNNLRIPEEKRHLFAQPLDTLIEGNREETIPKLVKKFKQLQEEGTYFEFYIVGDIVTKDFLDNKFLRQFIKLCIIDEKTQRNKIDIDWEGYFENEISFKNPKGQISQEAWEILKDFARTEQKTILKITEGEEDILVLPLISELPIEKGKEKYVFYGQPPITDATNPIPEGIVLVELNRKIKKRVKQFIKIMENLGQ